MRLKLLYSLFTGCLMFTQALGQHLPIDPETNKITYLEEVQLDTNVTAGSIHSACAAWVSSYYKNSDQLQTNNKIRGRMVKNANFPVFRRLYGRGGVDVEGGFIQYTISFIIHTKGRYTIAISDFRHTDPATGKNYGSPEEFYAMSSRDFAIMKYYMDQIDTFSKELMQSAKSYVEGSAR
jgi:hypothetical protein